MGLILVLLIASLAIAGSAAYFSVIGLAAMFSAAYWPVIVMGSSLELGKLVAASFVYRTWDTTGTFMKSYLIGAIFVLMSITSLGIFGFLSQGYGDSTQKLKAVQFTIAAKQKEVVQVDDRLNQINRTVEAVPNSYISKRMELKEDYALEVKALIAKRDSLNATMVELQKEKMIADAHVGPIIYVAEMFGVSVQDAVKFFILALILVFDPMAVILTLATNHAIEQYQLKRKSKRERILAEKREHELAVIHEKAIALTTMQDSHDPEQSTGQSTDDNQHGNHQDNQPAPLATGTSQETVGNGRHTDQHNNPSNDPNKVTIVPAVVSLRATKTKPTVSEMNALLQKTPSKTKNASRRADKVAANNAKNDLKKDLALDDADTIMVGGVKVHNAVIDTLMKVDQELLRGLSRGLATNVLASKLSMSDVTIRKRCTYLATLLNESDYKVDPKAMFN